MKIWLLLFTPFIMFMPWFPIFSFWRTIGFSSPSLPLQFGIPERISSARSPLTEWGWWLAKKRRGLPHRGTAVPSAGARAWKAVLRRDRSLSGQLLTQLGFTIGWQQLCWGRAGGGMPPFTCIEVFHLFGILQHLKLANQCQGIILRDTQ